MMALSVLLKESPNYKLNKGLIQMDLLTFLRHGFGYVHQWTINIHKWMNRQYMLFLEKIYILFLSFSTFKNNRPPCSAVNVT